QFWSRAGVPPADGEAAGSSSTGILPVDGAKRRPPHASPDAGKMPALLPEHARDARATASCLSRFEMRPARRIAQRKS
ncbi:MAG: hypothetical protein LBM04_02940, partial [Opitutaceae bacterium]|nr:hypothetical protein [Opitutaceae bacterium]